MTALLGEALVCYREQYDRLIGGGGGVHDRLVAGSRLIRSGL